MGQARLPSGELVDPRDVTSVTPSFTVSEWHIDVNLKNGDTIAIACASERDLQETLKRVDRLLDEPFGLRLFCCGPHGLAFALTIRHSPTLSGKPFAKIYPRDIASRQPPLVLVSFVGLTGHSPLSNPV
jgi:hypothetical protein